MKPLGLVGWGFLLILLDLNINRIDLIPDLVGWPMCLVGLSRLPRSSWFIAAQIGCLLGLAAEVAGLVNPPDGWIVQTAGSIAPVALVVGVCVGLLPFVGERDRATARAIAMTWAAFHAAVAVFVQVAPSNDDSLDPLVLIGVVLGLALAVWFIVFMFRLSRTAPLVPTVA